MKSINEKFNSMKVLNFYRKNNRIFEKVVQDPSPSR